MIRAADLDKTLLFSSIIWLVEVVVTIASKAVSPSFLAAPGDADEAEGKQSPLVEITYNWDPETYDTAAILVTLPIALMTSTRRASDSWTAA